MKLYVILLALLISGCNSINDEKVQYKKSKSLPTLEIPPNLTELNDDKNFALPGSTLGTIEAVGKSGQKINYTGKVLPNISGISLKGSGDFHWLEINQEPQDVYTVLKSFWVDEGFNLIKDEPLIGIMQTEWLDSSSGQLNSEDNRLFSILKSISDSEIKDQYKTRIEIGSEESSSRVYLSHKGKEYVLDTDNRGTKRTEGWQPRESDPELEAEMLSRMMIYVGMQDAQVEAELQKIGTFPTRARIVKTEDDVLPTVILVENYDRAWNRTLLALDRLGIEYVEKNKSNGVISINQKLNTGSEGIRYFDTFASNQSQVEFNINVEKRVAQTSKITVFLGGNEIENIDPAKAVLNSLYKSLK